MATTSKREIQLQKFNEIYNKLNAAQKQAVDTIEGPVMVIAGPGTGKTQILGARIGKILLETDTQPDNILCLTYTDAGVIAMRKRLLSFIGPDAYKVNIATFHAFCNDVIQENLSLFEKTSLDPVTDLQKIELYKQLIDGFGKNHPLKRYRGDVYYEIHNLQSLFSAMKREGWSPAFINSRIDAYINDLPNRDEYVCKRATGTFKKGDIRIDKIADECEKMERLRAAVNEFDNFQKLMLDRKLYDFDDMINWVIKVFEENDELLNRYQEQYLYILVDEFQDTSGTQNKIVELLINFWDRPNVFVVGDDDQSIYRFQGANVENMLRFAESYKEDLLKVVLTDNYRSTQPILDISKSVISRNNERLIKQLSGLSKDLLAANTSINHLTHFPTLKEYNTPRDEMIGLTLEVEALLRKGVKPNCIGIIYRENKYGDELTKYFKLRGIPHFSRRNTNLLYEPLAQQIISVLRYLAAEHDTPYEGDEMLFEILHYNWFGIAPMEVAKVSMEVAERQYTANKTSIRKWLYDKATQPPRDLFAKPMSEKLQKASEFLESLIAAVPNCTLQQLLEKLVRESGALHCIMQSEEKHQHMQIVTGLYDFIKEETSRNPLLTLQQLVNIFDLMEKEGISMPLIQVNGSEKGVNLMTAHGSKGLEYEYIFMAGCNAAGWEKKRKPRDGYALPDTLFMSVSRNAEEEELRRLFYVALTRAQKHLTVSYPMVKSDGKPTEPSMFIAEMQEEHTLETQMVMLPDDVVTEFRALEFGLVQAPEIARMEREVMQPIIDRFVMNVSALNNYLRCPLEFYFRNLVNIPSPRNEAAEFGSAVHHALQRLFEQMQRYNEFPSAYALVQDFEWYMYRHRELFTKEQFERRMEYGQEILTNYYNKYVNTWNTVVAIERNIKGVVVNGIPLKGKIDKLEFDGTDVNVVDYKTGDLDYARAKLCLPNDKEPNGGDYWRQAVFYKILLDHYAGRKWNAVSFEFDFIEPDKKGDYLRRKVIVQPEDITTVNHQIITVWNKIQQHDFYTGCGKPDCHWCNFVKSNNMAVALHEIEPVIEEEVKYG
jgi:DNA helicase-2/ATP-dependent DNA helicase PcrA